MTLIFWHIQQMRHLDESLETIESNLIERFFSWIKYVIFFYYLHHPWSNYRKRLPSYMEMIHIKRNYITYGQLFKPLSIHNNLSSLPIAEIGPIHIEKDIVSFIKSQVFNIFLPKYLQWKWSGDQMFVLIYHFYISFNLLTQSNPFICYKRYFSSIEEIFTMPLTK